MALPPRDYQLAGRLLAEAVDRSRTEGTDVTTAVAEAAGAEGQRIETDLAGRLRGTAKKGCVA